MGKNRVFSNVFLGLTLFGSFSFADSNTQIDPALYNFGKGFAEVDTVKIIAVMANPSGIEDKAPPKYSREAVLNFLRYREKESFKVVSSFLNQHPEGRGHFVLKNRRWLSNTFTAEVTPEGLQLISQSPGITKIYANHKIENIFPAARRKKATDEEVEAIHSYGLDQIGLTELLKQRPELNGKGVTLGVLDTGVDATHPALQGKITKFFDGETSSISEPKEYDTHGTHVCGTIVGGDREHIQIGVAPAAKLIVGGVLNSYDQMLAGMEFMLDPDQNPKTADAPRAVNNSWHAPGAPDIELFYRAVAAWEASGILPVFAAGNSGPRGKTIGRPQVHPASLAVAASDSNGKIADFSSRGPGIYNDKSTMKPEITAPGVNVPSSVPGPAYEEYSGTSMASPHITGSVGILLQINPNLTPAQLRELLLKTVTPLNEDGSARTAIEWNKVYGYGKVNLNRAVQTLIKLQTNVNSLINSKMNWLDNFFAGPFQNSFEGFFSEEKKLKMADLEMPEAEKSKDWLKPSDLL